MHAYYIRLYVINAHAFRDITIYMYVGYNRFGHTCIYNSLTRMSLHNEKVQTWVDLYTRSVQKPPHAQKAPISENSALPKYKVCLKVITDRLPIITTEFFPFKKESEGLYRFSGRKWKS